LRNTQNKKSFLWHIQTRKSNIEQGEETNHTVAGDCHIILFKLFATQKASQAWMKFRRSFGPTLASPFVPTDASLDR
jgi:hypothetical protein